MRKICSSKCATPIRYSVRAHHLCLFPEPRRQLECCEVWGHLCSVHLVVARLAHPNISGNSFQQVRQGISIKNKGSDLDRSIWLADKRTRARLLLWNPLPGWKAHDEGAGKGTPSWHVCGWPPS
jgi:hypothetical protein